MIAGDMDCSLGDAEKPNPGSDEALDAGCLCAVLDNGHGRHPYMGWNDDGSGNWSIRGDCPMHGFLP